MYKSYSHTVKAFHFIRRWTLNCCHFRRQHLYTFCIRGNLTRCTIWEVTSKVDRNNDSNFDLWIIRLERIWNLCYWTWIIISNTPYHYVIHTLCTSSTVDTDRELTSLSPITRRILLRKSFATANVSKTESADESMDSMETKFTQWNEMKWDNIQQ